MAIVCICRGTKSGGNALAARLGARLKAPVLGREVAQEAARRLGVSPEALEAKMGDRPSLWGRLSSMRRAYIVAVQAALAEHAAGGHLVYHGLAGGLLLRGLPGTLCLRLIAPLQRRIEAVTRDTGMDPPAARQFIQNVDASRARWVRVMYGEDILDPSLYDLVVNLETLSIEGAEAVVARTVAQPEFAPTVDVHEALEDFRLACGVRLALVGDADLRPLGLEAEARRGSVVITGEAPLRRDGRTGDRIVELARSVPGVEAIRLQLEWFDPYP